MRKAPELWWDPGWLQSSEPLTSLGELSGSPYPTLTTALAAVSRRRGGGGAGSPWDNVFLLTWTRSGWAVFEYRESRLSTVDLKELDVRDLPLGGSIDDPQTYLLDGSGRLGKLFALSQWQGFQIREVDPSAVSEPDSAEAFVSAVVPQELRNHAGNVRWRPVLALRPDTSIDDLADSLRWIDQRLPREVKIKAGGSRHSWSPAPATNGVYVYPDETRGIEALSRSEDAPLIRGDVPVSHLVRVLAGTRIREINSGLWTNRMALPWLGGYDGQTLAGVLQTGTHGSTLRHGPLAEMVRSLDMVCFDGTRVRLEPESRAITAPDAFARERPGWRLVQGDDDFNAALVSLGTMGVVHAFLIEAAERFWLKEVRTSTTMDEAQSTLRGGNVYHLMENTGTPEWVDPADGRAFPGHPKPAFHQELLWNPYTDKVVVTSRHPVDEAKRRELEQAEPPWFANAPVRDLFRALKLDVMASEYSRPDLPELLTENFSGVIDEVLEVIARARPELLPKFIDSGLAGMADPSYIQRSYKVFNIGDGANQIPAQSGTISVPLRSDLWLAAIDVIRTAARRIAAERAQYQTGPIALRFVRGSPILLADPEDVCKYEIILGGDDAHVRALSEDLVREYYHALYEAFGADVRLHWGQLIPERTLELPGRSGHRVRESYPRYDVWRGIRDNYDPANRGLTPWLERLLP